MKKLLLISPYFPPMAVIGAKRALNLSRHLPHFGWKPIILCSEPTRERVDPALNALIGSEAIISRTYRHPRRTRHSSTTSSASLPTSSPATSSSALPSQAVSLELAPPKIPKISLLERITGWHPGYLTPFDREQFGVRYAIREAIRLAQEHEVDAVAVSADPWSALITASAVSQRLNIPLIADLRDPWTLHTGKSKLRPPPILAIMKWYEKRLFKHATRVILNTESCMLAYQARYGHLIPEDRLTYVRNASDSSMFGEWAPPRTLEGRPFELTYFGQFRRFVRPDTLFAGIKAFVQARDLSPDEFRLVMISSLDGYAYEAARRFDLLPWIESRPSVSFSESFETLQRADALALVDGGCPLVIAGKLYDYLTAGRPIISVARSTEVAQVIAESGAGISANPDDPAEVASALESLYDAARRGEHMHPDPAKLEPFDAPAQAQRYAQTLDAALRDHQSR